jgi:hypothetical protein
MTLDPWTITDGVVSKQMHWSDAVYHVLHSHKVHVVFSILLVVDILITIASISLEIEYLNSKTDDYADIVHSCQVAISGLSSDAEAECYSTEIGKSKYRDAMESLAIVSLTILSVFCLESAILLLSKP